MLTPPSDKTKTLRQALLSPRSVALIGQSNDAGKTAGRPLLYLRQAGYKGRIFPINARRDTVLGERAWPSVQALPEVPEHAYIVTPTDAALEAIEECGKAGVAVATVLANGFAEAGEEGLKREARIKEICRQTGLRVVGPSSLGVVNLREGVLLTANAAFAEKDLPVGRIFAASHSGSLIGALASRGKERGIGFSGLVSVGNEADLSIGEICAATLDDPDIDGYLLFLETLRKADHLRSFALAAAARGKPIVAYKLGRSAAAREMAISHTGALAGEDDVAEMFLRECGIARASTFEGLIECLPLLAHMPARQRGARPPRVGVVTTTTGGAMMALDPLATRGITIEQPSSETLAKLQAAGIEIAPSPRLIDLTTAGARYEVMKKTLDILLAAPEFDLLLAAIGSSARFHPELAVQPIIDSAQAKKPLAAYLVPAASPALAMLGKAGVPNFRTPEACADAIAAALSRQVPRALGAQAEASAGPGKPVDELAAYQVLDRIGIARAPSVAVETDLSQAPRLPFSYPLAVKALSAAIAHKSDVSGVVLGVADDKHLLSAIAQIRRKTKASRVLIQPMIEGVGEVLLGYRVDRDVGPLVMLAAGGVLAEIHRDRALRLAPVDRDEARVMIGELRSFKTLTGYRGKPPGDLDALADAIVKLSQLANGNSVVEAEINPLIVQENGVVAVDALVRCT